MKKIVIIGGGTAGWLTALYVKKRYKNYNITLLESTKIGILGAGEGGTPTLRSMLLEGFGFDEVEFLKEKILKIKSTTSNLWSGKKFTRIIFTER